MKWVSLRVAIETRDPESPNLPTGLLQMIIPGVIFCWFSVTLLYTFALCLAASRPTPKPGLPGETPASGSFDHQFRSHPTYL